jgi:hypothetical protein
VAALDCAAFPHYFRVMHKWKLVMTPPAEAPGPTGTSPMAAEIFTTLDWSEPPKDMSKPLQALWWLKKGEFRIGMEWERAHVIVQSMEGVQAFDWVHALMHWIEADLANADYWYRRAGKRRATASVSTEWEHMAAALSEVTKH